MYNAAKVRLSNSEIQSIPKRILQLAILDALMSRDTMMCGTTGHASHTSHTSIPVIKARKAAQQSATVS